MKRSELKTPIMIQRIRMQKPKLYCFTCNCETEEIVEKRDVKKRNEVW